MDSNSEGGGGDVSGSLCILCLKSSAEKTSVFGESGWQKIKEASATRKALLDNENASVIERVLSIANFASGTLVYHRSCYEKFTNKTKLDRLKKAKDSKPTEFPATETTRTLRSASVSYNKELCIICQVTTVL